MLDMYKQPALYAMVQECLGDLRFSSSCSKEISRADLQGADLQVSGDQQIGKTKPPPPPLLPDLFFLISYRLAALPLPPDVMDAESGAPASTSGTTSGIHKTNWGALASRASVYLDVYSHFCDADQSLSIACNRQKHFDSTAEHKECLTTVGESMDRDAQDALFHVRIRRIASLILMSTAYLSEWKLGEALATAQEAWSVAVGLHSHSGSASQANDDGNEQEKIGTSIHQQACLGVVLYSLLASIWAAFPHFPARASDGTEPGDVLVELDDAWKQTKTTLRLLLEKTDTCSMGKGSKPDLTGCTKGENHDAELLIAGSRDGPLTASVKCLERANAFYARTLSTMSDEAELCCQLEIPPKFLSRFCATMSQRRGSVLNEYGTRSPPFPRWVFWHVTR
eukprot:scaffold897_cov402-Prasinococcus_capsulatus_cf.AAC.49